ncbi:egl nine homolog 1-like [Patiria miniata]|uniref:hypoxia-inducible factor-proline dioxygenase n=1 Tax=Patiria miniata TaxID=46514 RepID=A0A914ASD9_PATMI|nr:egl nine homolog 1-like [Patiria miniata]
MADNAEAGNFSCKCCKSTENLKTCSKCKSVFYCSREHQLQDWKKHRRYCKKISQDHHQEEESMADLAREATVSKPMKTNSRSAANHNGRPKQDNIIPVMPVEMNNLCVESSNETAKANSESTTQNEKTFTVNEKKTLKSCSTVLKHEQNVGHEQNGSQSSPNYDPRPFIQTDFPHPKSRDGDTLARHAAVHLQKSGYCVLDGFLNQEHSLNVLREVKSIQDSGVLIDGPLSGGRTSSEKSKKFTKRVIRGDKITWLQGQEESCPRINSLIAQMDELIQRLNYFLQGQYAISGRTKAMVACYPGNGAGYACHVDNPNRDGRCVTCIYYLNDKWDVTSQGGLLRLLPVSGGHVDVEPLLNRLLLFWSDRRNPHEVQPAFDMRYAITVWYFDKSEREEAKMAQLNEDMSKLRGEVSLPDVKEQKERKDHIEEEIQKKSSDAVAGLSSAELQALSGMLEGQPDPRAILTSHGVAPTIQDALLCQLKGMK